MTAVAADPGIKKELLFKKIGYVPHPGQRMVHDSEAKYRVPCCGRRWGKSQVAGHELTASMFIPNTRWWIVGPTYALAEKEFRVVHDDIFRKLGAEHHSLISRCRKSYNVKQGDMRIEMPWNTILEAKSAEKKDGLVGEGLMESVSLRQLCIVLIPGICICSQPLQTKTGGQSFLALLEVITGTMACGALGRICTKIMNRGDSLAGTIHSCILKAEKILS